ncbi:HNH endonuclease [Bacillus safensis]|uniref:HNH endonuclease n=1 Tax=Bacillus safensis TaxID=561879 RepID=UPI002282709F|nr:HNH endonuclease [Bacillus safensis]MCY7711243.1 HNH endonuclease [Bacillus safensis]MCY7727278.1 HNH endonuclease [Bacillus safensis]MED0883168.1 HNH endonuclease [Bacillus safensis]MED0918454.1 HNH endonuclease [Bacillus safensis]
MLSLIHLDENTRDALLKKEKRIKEITNEAYTLIGRELKEAQQLLANHGYGCFGEWVRTSIGMSKGHAYRLIYRYELISENPTIASYLEDLPVSLLYEVSKPLYKGTDVGNLVRNAVLKGEIRSLKAFKELKKTIDNKTTRTDSKSVTSKLTKDIDGPIYCSTCDIDCSPIVNWHHIVPIHFGGDNSEDNLTPLCPNCHTIIHRALTKKGVELNVGDWIIRNFTVDKSQKILHLIEIANLNTNEGSVVA